MPTQQARSQKIWASLFARLEHHGRRNGLVSQVGQLKDAIYIRTQCPSLENKRGRFTFYQCETTYLMHYSGGHHPPRNKWTDAQM